MYKPNPIFDTADTISSRGDDYEVINLGSAPPSTATPGIQGLAAVCLLNPSPVPGWSTRIRLSLFLLAYGRMQLLLDRQNHQWRIAALRHSLRERHLICLQGDTKWNVIPQPGPIIDGIQEPRGIQEPGPSKQVQGFI